MRRQTKSFAIIGSIMLLLLFANALFGQTPVDSKKLEELTRYELISLVISAISAVFLLIGFYVTVITIRKNHDWNRRYKSMEALAAATDQSRIADLQILNKCLKYSDSYEPIQLDLIDSKVEENPQLLHILLNRLNIFELYAIGVFNGVYDEEVMKHAVEAVMDRAYFRFENFIKRRKESNSTYCEHFESIVIKWRNDKRKVIPRRKTA